jgi:riboflavin synthase
MFTGIVESVGEVAAVTPVAEGARLRIATPLAASLRPGDSLGVSGVCLTAVAVEGGHIVADVGPETARVTTLGRLRPGDAVNLERPLRADGRFDGHFVLGHVDAVTAVVDVRPQGEAHRVALAVPPGLARLFVAKGSVTVDGVSLTVAALGTGVFDVQVIPYTWAHTTLQYRRPGDEVNLECDVIGKYVARALDARQA